MAYFDNAATTYPKPECVYEFMNKFYRTQGASAGRGIYQKAITAGELIMDTRQRIRNLLMCPAKQVIFTPTATIALNMVLQGSICDKIKTVYISPFEHNAVTRVLHHFEANGLITVKELKVSEDYRYDIEKIRYQFDEKKPDLVVVSHASNVLGLVAPIEDVFKLAKRHNAITVADMSQTAGLVECNVGLDVFDFAVFAGHKTLYGPTGISGFVMKPDIELRPVLFGGTGYDSANQDMPSNLPERFEMGTTNILGIAGLNAALKWIEEIGVDKIREKEETNRHRLIELLARYPFISLVGNNEENSYVGIVSVIIEGISSDSAGTIFAKNNIAVRTGLHCAPRAHVFTKTYPAGTVRFSVNYFTDEEDFRELSKTLDYIEDNL